MTCLTLKMTEKFTGCQEYQPRLELRVFRKKKKAFTGALYQNVFAGNAEKCINHFYMDTNSSALFNSSKQIN